MACGAKEEVPSRLSQQVSEGDESGSPYEHSGSTRCSGGKVGELGLGDSTLEEQLAVLSLWLFPAGILVINGLEGVSHTPEGIQLPWLTGEQKTHRSVLLLKWRKTPPCPVSDLAAGSEE